MTGTVRFKGADTRDTEVSAANPLPVTSAGSQADGSRLVAGSNGTSRATAANPLNTAVNGVNGTGIATAANPFPTRDYGSATIAAGQVSAGTASTQIVAARSGRMAVTIVNGGTNDVFIGVTGVTITTGVLLPGTKGASVTIPTQAAVFGVAAVAQTVSFIETF